METKPPGQNRRGVGFCGNEPNEILTDFFGVALCFWAWTAGRGRRAWAVQVAQCPQVNDSGANVLGLPGIAFELAMGDQDSSLVTNTLTFNRLGIMFAHPC